MTSDWILDLIDRGGAAAVAFLMFAENVFPPIPSEVVMPVAGISASTGVLSLSLVILLGTAGSVAGQSLWFWIGTRVTAPRLKRWAARHGRWLTLTPRDIDRVTRWFDEHGTKAVLFGRLIPGLRTFISLPAGIAGMSWRRFLLYTSAGSLVWTALLAVAGYALHDQHARVTGYIGPVSTVVLIALLGVYIYRVVTFKA